jgi:hypothetical protein
LSLLSGEPGRLLKKGASYFEEGDDPRKEHEMTRTRDSFRALRMLRVDGSGYQEGVRSESLDHRAGASPARVVEKI